MQENDTIAKVAQIIANICMTIIAGVTIGLAIIYWKWTILLVILLYIGIWMVKHHQEFKEIDDDQERK